MKTKSFIYTVLLVILVVAISYVFFHHHKYFMRGTVLEVVDGTIYLCVGSSDGAKAGQELTVIRVVNTGNFNPKGYPVFERKEVGKVKILEIVDEHMANAKIISGEAKLNDIVELKK